MSKYPTPYRWWEIWLHAALASWRLTVLMVGSVVGIYLVLHFYLAPATAAWQHATPERRRLIGVTSTLLLAVMLVLLTLGVVWAARRRR